VQFSSQTHWPTLSYHSMSSYVWRLVSLYPQPTYCSTIKGRKCIKVLTFFLTSLCCSLKSFMFLSSSSKIRRAASICALPIFSVSEGENHTLQAFAFYTRKKCKIRPEILHSNTYKLLCFTCLEIIPGLSNRSTHVNINLILIVDKNYPISSRPPLCFANCTSSFPYFSSAFALKDTF